MSTFEIHIPCGIPFIAAHDDRKKRPRTAFSASQIKALETEFERGKYLSVAKRTALAKQLQLTETQVRRQLQEVALQLQ